MDELAFTMEMLEQDLVYELSSHTYMKAARAREAIAAQHGKLAAKNLNTYRLRGSAEGRILRKYNAARRNADKHMDAMRLNMDIANRAREKAQVKYLKEREEDYKKNGAHLENNPTKWVTHNPGSKYNKRNKHMSEPLSMLDTKRVGR